MQTELRKRFTNHVLRNWVQNDHYLKDIPCVYAMVSLNLESSVFEIDYIGSTIKLMSRYKSHKVPDKIYKTGKISLLYYLPMSSGFYDYEIKLIGKLKPTFNKQHKNGR